MVVSEDWSAGNRGLHRRCLEPSCCRPSTTPSTVHRHDGEGVGRTTRRALVGVGRGREARRHLAPRTLVGELFDLVGHGVATTARWSRPRERNRTEVIGECGGARGRRLDGSDGEALVSPICTRVVRARCHVGIEGAGASADVGHEARSGINGADTGRGTGHRGGAITGGRNRWGEGTSIGGRGGKVRDRWG